MNAIVLFEDEGYVNLLPLTWWRTVFELRVGRKIILDRTAQALGTPIAGVWTRDWIAPIAAQRCGAPANRPINDGVILVNGRWLFDGEVSFPSAPCAGTIGDEIVYVICDAELAGKLSAAGLLDPRARADALEDVERVEAPGRLVRYPWEIIRDLPDLITADWKPSDASVESELSGNVCVEPADRIHVGARTRIHPTAVIDATAGPIFISHDVQIGAYAVIEGPTYLGPGTQVSPGAWLHGGNTIGPVCKIGGELEACVIQGYTNKQHGGFLGHAFVGSWVNFGAGAVNSNLKNTYGSVRVSLNRVEIDTGQMFFGAIIGDHAKVGINATIPAGAIIGMAASIITSRVVPRSIPSFAWVTEEGVREGDPARMLDVATKAMSRRGIDMTDEEVELFLHLGDIIRPFEGRPLAR